MTKQKYIDLTIKLICCIAAAALGLSSISAQETGIEADTADSDVLTLHDCMAYAISNSTKMSIQQAATGDARIDRRDAALAMFTPEIDASTYGYYNFGRSIDPQTNTYFKTTSFHNNYGVSAGFNLFNGFKAVNNFKISRTGLQIASSQEKQVEADICLAVMEAYYNVVYYKNLADVYDEQVSTAEASLKKARRQEELGQKGHADVVQMEADLADRKYDLVNTMNMYHDQKMTLADLMFWPLDKELNVETGWSSFAADVDDDSASSDSVIDFALEHNPGVQIAQWTKLNAKRDLATARWQLLPTIGLYAGWSTSYYTYEGSHTDPFHSQFKNNGGEYVEASMSIPIFGRLQQHSAIAKKRNALRKATAEYDQKLRDVESEVRRAIQDRDGTEAAWHQAQYKSEVQEEAYTLSLKKLEQGLISPLEFHTANDNYLKARADEMNSLFQYLIKQAVVKYYNGTDYIDQ